MKIDKEKKIIIAWVVLVSFFALIPLIYGYINQTPEKTYTGLTATIYPEDVNGYYAWIKQAHDGAFLFEDKFTSESHNTWIFQPIFLLIGYTARFLRVNIDIIWYLTIIISNLLFLYIVYEFLKNFFPNQDKNNNASNLTESDSAAKTFFESKSSAFRIFTFILITVSSGFAWFAASLSADFLQPELTVFQSLRWPFIFSISTAFILLIFLSILKYERTDNNKFIVQAGVLTLFLSIIHPYDIFIVIPIGITYLLFKRISPEKLKKTISAICLYLILVVPGIIYNLYVTAYDPVFSAHSKIKMLSFPPLSYVLGYGVLFFLSIVGAYYIIKQRKKELYFLLFWIIAGFLLAYSPLSFQRRLLMGLQIPLAIISAFAIFEIGKRYAVNIKTFFVIAAIIVVFSSIDSAAFLLTDIDYLKKNSFPFFLDKNLLSALNWMNINTDNRDIILSSREIGNFIPRYTGNRVFIGHWAQTINIEQKQKEVEKFYSLEASKQEMNDFLKANSISYVLCGDFEFECKNKIWEEKMLALNAAIIFNNQSVKLYKINNPSGYR